MKTNLPNFKLIANIIILCLSLNYSQAQFITNFGVGAGFWGGKPSSINVETVRSCTVPSSTFACLNSSNPGGTVFSNVTLNRAVPNRSFITQVGNLSFEPRYYLLDSTASSVGLSFGMPLNFSVGIHSRDGNEHLKSYEEFDMNFQGALLAYLDFGNGAYFANMYSKKHGFSLGAGVMYSYLGVFGSELRDLNPPPNNLIQPVISLSFRFLSVNNVLSEFNATIRPIRRYFFQNQAFNDCCNIVDRGPSINETGVLFQYRLFFGR